MVIVIGTWLILEIQPDAVSTLPPGVIIDSDSKTLADRVQFNDITLRLGINARHHQNSGKLTSLTETLGGGLCVFDVNKDGWQDVLFITGSGTRRHYGQPSWWSVEQTNKLYLNTSSGRQFVDVTEQYGLDSSSWGMGCVTADLNNDSLPDLIIFGIGANQLYINNGNGFVRKESVAGFNEDIWTTGALVEDVNHDGLLDIYVTNFIRYEQGQKTYE